MSATGQGVKSWIQKAADDAATMLRRARESSTQRGGAAASSWEGDASFATSYPMLWSTLVSSLVDPSVEQANTLTMWITEEGITACLSLRDLKLKTFATAPTVLAVAGILEAFLGESEPAWRDEHGKRKPKKVVKTPTSKPR